MYPENSLSHPIKDMFLNHRGRFSRETFVVTFAGLSLFMTITSPLLYKLCGLFLPWLIVVLLTTAYVGYMIYAMFVLCIKRLHDMNLTGWYSLSLFIPFLNIIFIAYLCLKTGDFGSNTYGDSLDYEGPSFLLVLSYMFMGLYVLAGGVGLYYGKKLGNIQNTRQGAQQLVDILPKAMQKELGNSPRAMGALFINNQFASAFASITKNRILVRGIDFKVRIQDALSKGQKVQIRFPDDSSANVIRLVTFDDSLTVQMSVFEIDRPIGTPAKLGEKNRKLLERMNAF